MKEKNVVEVVVEKKDFKALLKSDFGIETKSRNREGSIFGIVRQKLSEDNESRDEVVYKVLDTLKSLKIEVNGITYKKVNKLLSNLLTYVRKSYPKYEGFKMIETQTSFKMVPK